MDRGAEGDGAFYGSNDYVTRKSVRLLNQLKEQIIPKIAAIKHGEKANLQKCEPAKNFTYFDFNPLQE